MRGHMPSALRSLGLAAAMLCIARTARAEPTSFTLSPRVRVQGGLITENRPSPAPRTEDLWLGAMPGVSLTALSRDLATTVDYQLNGAVHSLGGASEISNYVNVAAAYEATPRLRLLGSGQFIQSSVTNLLVTQGAATNVVTVLPTAANKIVTARVGQGLSYELTSRLRLEQSADASVFTTLAPTPPLDTFSAGLGGAIDHSWRNDAVGFETRATYTIAHFIPPLLDQSFFTFTGGPRWRRDWSPSWTTSIAAGATSLVSTDTAAETRVAPFARASALYLWAPTQLDLALSTGFTPSILSSQIFQAHQATLRGTRPIWEHQRLYGSASIGYLRASLIDVRDQGLGQDFDAFLSDVEVSWQALPLVQVFARYQFIAQIGERQTTGLNPSMLRDVLLLGFQLTTRPPNAEVASSVPTTFGRRVDRSDERLPAATRPEDEPRLPNRPEDGRVRERRPEEPPGPSEWIYTLPAPRP